MFLANTVANHMFCVAQLLMNAYNTLFCSSSLALSAADIPEVASRNFLSAELLSIDKGAKKMKLSVKS